MDDWMIMLFIVWWIFMSLPLPVPAPVVSESDLTTHGWPSSILGPGCSCRPPRLQYRLFGHVTDPEFPLPIHLKGWMRKQSPKRLQPTNQVEAPAGAVSVTWRCPWQRSQVGVMRLLQVMRLKVETGEMGTQVQLMEGHMSLCPSSPNYPEVSLCQLSHVLSHHQRGAR